LTPEQFTIRPSRRTAHRSRSTTTRTAVTNCICSIEQARLFRDALADRGWVDGEEYEYVELGEEGHGSTDIQQKIRAFEHLSDYLSRRL